MESLNRPGMQEKSAKGKIFPVVAVLTILFASTSCSDAGEKGNEIGGDSTETADSQLVNAIRHQNIKKEKTVFLISAPDDPGRLQSASQYDRSGNLIREVTYGNSNSGKPEDTTSFEYDGRDSLLSSGTKNEKIVYVYDGQGKLAEKKVYAGDRHKWTQLSKYELDPAGRMISESRWEQFQDGSPDQELFHYVHQYDESGRRKSSFALGAGGDTTSQTVYHFDRRGNVTIAEEFVRHSLFPGSRIYTNFNEYGEAVEIRRMACSGPEDCKEWSREQFRYDDSGNATWHFIWQNDGENFGQKMIYEYWQQDEP